MTAAIPQVGDQVYLGSTNALAHWFGYVTDGEIPNGLWASMEWGGEEAVISLAALVGPQGPAGEASPIVQMQYDSSVSNPIDLPSNLTNTSADIGKAWWIGNVVYIWSGHTYVQKVMGTVGPPGPLPVITPQVELVDPTTSTSQIIKTGTDAAPSWMFQLAVPAGPPGPSGPIRAAADYDNTTAPALDDVITWNGLKYAPKSLTSLIPRCYSVPESAFTSTTGFNTTIPIGSFTLPPQPFAYVPMVWGHIKAIGADLSTDPFTIGCEVRSGDPTAGTLIGRGFGNIASWAHITPHFSTPTNAAQAITPDNGYAVIPANDNSTASNINVNLKNDGIVGVYSFNASNAQLLVMCVPVYTGGTPAPGITTTILDGGSL